MRVAWIDSHYLFSNAVKFHKSRTWARQFITSKLKRNLSMRILQMVIELTIFKVFKLLTLIIKAMSLRKISNSLPAILPLPSWKNTEVDYRSFELVELPWKHNCSNVQFFLVWIMVPNKRIRQLNVWCYSELIDEVFFLKCVIHTTCLSLLFLRDVMIKIILSDVLY